MSPLLCLCACAALGQCRTCVTHPVVVAVPPVWEWRRHDADPTRLYLYRHGQLQGGLDTAEGYFRPYEAGVWGPRGAIDLPATRKQHAPEAPTKVGATDNYGVDWGQIASGGDRYGLDGRPASREEVLRRIGSVPDDRGKLRLTLIGSEDDCKKALADLHNDPQLAGLRGKCLIQDYRPTDWAVARAGFRTDGRPTIYLQAPPDARGRGKVLARLDSYPGPEALRKIDPDYRPERDPDPTRPPAPTPPPQPQSQFPAWPLLVAAGALFLVLIRRRSGSHAVAP